MITFTNNIAPELNLCRQLWNLDGVQMAACKGVDTNANFAGVSIFPQNALTALISSILHLYENSLVEVSRGIERRRIQMQNDQSHLLWCKTKGTCLISEQKSSRRLAGASPIRVAT